MRNLVAAIDLGTTKVVCAVGEKTPSGIQIIAHSQAPSKGVMRGEVINIQQVLNAIKPVISNVENQIGYKIQDVYVGIAGQNIRCASNAAQFTRKQPDELITKEEIDELTADMYGSFVQNGEKVLHVIPQSYNIDDFMGITDPVGMIGQQINANFKLFIGRSNSAQFVNNVINRAGLTLHDIALEPLASARAVLSEEECEIGVAVLDIGGGTSDLLIIQDGIIRHAAVIPFGGNSITEDIRNGCCITSKIAETLKVQYGSCYSAIPSKKSVIIPGIGGRESKEISFSVLTGIIEARMAEILEAADYEIERSGYKSQLQAGLVITGGSSQMLNIRDLASVITGMECRTASPQENISSQSLSDVYHPAQSTIVGLILNGFDKKSKSYRQPVAINYEGGIFGDDDISGGQRAGNPEDSDHNKELQSVEVESTSAGTADANGEKESKKTRFGGFDSLKKIFSNKSLFNDKSGKENQA